MFLRASFDDSGTHAASNLAVWGGVIGQIEDFTRLEQRWAAFLASPAEDGRSISKWSSFDCRWGKGEFEGWKEGARDRARCRARKCIIDSGVLTVAFGVPKKQWAEILGGVFPASLNSANDAALAKCGEAAVEIAHRRKQAIACVIDKGQRSKIAERYLALLDDLAQRRQVPVSWAFQAVIDNYGLQAADCVATECYWAAEARFNGESSELDKQQQAFFANVDPIAYVMTDRAMKHLAQTLVALRDAKA